jgi:DNA repair exonuclease SbcCD ATPase subunit
MRNIEFQEVGMENYGPYIEEMVLTFTKDTITLLCGPNGIGKTMALDALPFTLYGITSKKAKGDDVVNNSVGKNCKTYVKFKINDDQYIITRYHKYSKLQNTVVINKNGIDIKKGQREVLPEIEKLVCPQKAFMNTLMFGQKVKDFFTDLVDSDKKEIFRKILNLEQYTEYYKIVDNNLKSAKETHDSNVNELKVAEGLLQDALEQIEILKQQKTKFLFQQNINIKEIKSSIEQNNRLKKSLSEKLKEFKDEDLDITTTIAEISKIETELATISEKYKTMFSDLENNIKDKLAELKEKATSAELDERDKVSEETADLNEKKQQLQEKLNNIDSEWKDISHKIDLETHNINNQIQIIMSKILEIDKNVLVDGRSECPLCNQEISDETKNKFIKDKQQFENEIEILKQQKEKKENESLSIQKELKIKQERIQIDITSCNDQIKQLKVYLQDKLREISSRLNDAQDKVNDAAESMRKDLQLKLMEETKTLQDKKKELEDEKIKKQEFINSYNETEISINEIDKKVQQLEYALEKETESKYDETQLNSYYAKTIKLNEKIEDIKRTIITISEEIELLTFWKTACSPSGIPSMLIDESIPFMNAKVSEYLDMLTNGRYIVSFDTLDETKAGEFRDKISVRVIDTHTQANSRVQLSGGQTRLVDIATILTLGDLQTAINNVKFNILLFDEIFDALDYDNATYVSKVLHKLKKDRAIYIISHQHQEQLEQDQKLELN